MSDPAVQHRGVMVDRLAASFSWVLLPSVVALGLIDSTQSVPGLTRVPLYLVGIAVLGLLGLVLFLLRSRQGGWRGRGASLLVTFLALVGYAAITTLYGTRQIIGPGRPATIIEVPLDIVRTPLAQAALTALTAWLLVVLTPRDQLLRRLWFTFVVVVPVSLIGYLRQFVGLGAAARLRTGMGGAATYHVVLLLGLAVMLAAARADLHRRWSQVLAGAFVLMILLTGARAGLVTLALFAVIGLLGLRGTRVTPRRWLPMLALGIVAAVVAFVISPLSRRLDGDTHGRLATWQLGWELVTSSPQRLVAGLGSGVVWPWFAFESGFRPAPYRSRVHGPFGWTLTNPHSLFVAVGTELGLIGAVLLLTVLALTLWRRLRMSARAPAAILLNAVLCTWVAFAFDLYLLKSFPVALLWWTVLFATFGRRRQHRDEPPGSAAAASPGQPLHSPA